MTTGDSAAGAEADSGAEGHHGASALTRGVVASVAASVLFGALFFLAKELRVLDADVFFAWRVIATLPVVAVLFTVFGGWRDVGAILTRVRRAPALVLVLVVDALLLGVQLWIFGWAPQTGHGLEAALGYLLLPLVMVVVGVALHSERLSLLRVLAVACAVIGVVAAIVVAGGVSPVTVVVALGYPLYFVLRRRARLDTTGSFSLELVILLPIAVWFLATQHGLAPLVASPALIVGVALLGIVSGAALSLYLHASSVLPFGLFGLLTYLEPVLLIAVSALLLGEPLTVADAFVYGPIAAALVLLAIEPFRRPSVSARP